VPSEGWSGTKHQTSLFLFKARANVRYRRLWLASHNRPDINVHPTRAF